MKIIIPMLVVAIGLMTFNAYSLSTLSTPSLSTLDAPTGASTREISTGISVLPTGVPEIYGEELQLAYDDVSPNNQQRANQAIQLLKQYDVGIELDEAQTKRYVNILYTLNKGLSCEYCCGAKSIIFENGQPACGCAHSFAMRGLTKYLLTEHPDLSDEYIQDEAAKWKMLFFPAQIQQKAGILAQKDIELSTANLATNLYRGVEQGKIRRWNGRRMLE